MTDIAEEQENTPSEEQENTASTDMPDVPETTNEQVQEEVKQIEFDYKVPSDEDEPRHTSYIDAPYIDTDSIAIPSE